MYAVGNALIVQKDRRGVEFAADRLELRLELTCDDEPLVYCLECWQREFGQSDEA